MFTVEKPFGGSTSTISTAKANQKIENKFVFTKSCPMTRSARTLQSLFSSHHKKLKQIDRILKETANKNLGRECSYKCFFPVLIRKMISQVELHPAL